MYGGAVYAPILGDTQTQRSCFAYIYKAILHAKNSGHSGYFAHFGMVHDFFHSGYFAQIIQIVNRFKYSLYYPLYPGSFLPTFSPSIQYPPSARSRFFTVAGLRSK